MKLIDSEFARWEDQGFLHLPNLLLPVARERIRSWVIAANCAQNTPTEHGLSVHSAADLTAHHMGLARVLERGLLPDLASQLLGGPARPARPTSEPSPRQVTCMVGLARGEAETIEVMARRHDQEAGGADSSWMSIEVRAGDLLWINGLAPVRRSPSRALFLEFRALDSQTTFGWSEQGLRALA